MFLQKILIMERVLRDSGLLSPAVPNGSYVLMPEGELIDNS